MKNKKRIKNMDFFENINFIMCGPLRNVMGLGQQYTKMDCLLLLKKITPNATPDQIAYLENAIRLVENELKQEQAENKIKAIENDFN